MKRKGITLIGMSEAGKTTLAPILAQKLGWPVYDVDDMIIKEQGKLIGQVLAEYGQKYLLNLETQCVNSLNLHQSVLATPGSIVYDTECHQKLREQTAIVWLDVPLITLKTRFGRDPKKAKAVIGADNGYEVLFNERRPLYAKLADIKIESGQLSSKELAKAVIKRLGY
jgi:shikimate kinase